MPAAGSAGQVRPVFRDPEVLERPRRRRFSAEYKPRILREVDWCTEPGQVGALLPREGLYSYHLTKWRRQRDESALTGLRGTRRGPKSQPKGRTLAKHVAQLERENRRLKGRLRQPKAILEIPTEPSELFGIPLSLRRSDEDS